MRAIKNFDDAKIILAELIAWKDKLEGFSWDFHGKRITNASPSKDDYDYVVRKELPKFEGQNIIFPPLYYTIEFTNPGDLAVGTKVCAPYIVPRYGEASLIEAYFVLNDAPTGGDASVELTLNEVSLCATPMTIADGDTYMVFSNFVSPTPNLKYLDLVNLNVLSVGSGTPGTGATVSLRVKRYV